MNLVPPFYITSKCINCGACLHECPTGAISAGLGRYWIDTDYCAEHQACVAVCPVNVIIPFDPKNPEPAPPAAKSPPSKAQG